MEFKEAMIVWKRMCAEYEAAECKTCPFDEPCGGFCRAFALTNPVEAEAILTKWAAEHPERTRIDDFLDKHPHAPMCDDGTPKACAYHCGYCAECSTRRGAAGCFGCWRELLEEAHHG